MITATPRSHLDHGLTRPQLTHVLMLLNGGNANVVVGPYGPFFIATIKLPEELGKVPCSLQGPIVGGEPVTDAEAYFGVRGNRPNPSRLCRRRKTNSPFVTAIVIANEDKPGDQRIDTVFGGPLSPMEVNDPELPAERKPESLEFWSKHALTPNSMEVLVEGILLARPNYLPTFVVPQEAAVVSELHITLAKLSKESRKLFKELKEPIPDAPEVNFEEAVCTVERPGKKAWVRFVDEAGQKILRDYVLSFGIPDLDEYDRTLRPYHVSLANLTGSKFDSVGDITPDRK
jgi:hypothetical protein